MCHCSMFDVGGTGGLVELLKNVFRLMRSPFDSKHLAQGRNDRGKITATTRHLLTYMYVHTPSLRQ